MKFGELIALFTSPPRVLKPWLAPPPGGEKLTSLKMLKNSERNCRLFDSVNLKFLNNAKSKLTSFGPVSVLRPRVPNVNWDGIANAAGLYQWKIFCWNPAGNSGTPFTLSAR